MLVENSIDSLAAAINNLAAAISGKATQDVKPQTQAAPAATKPAAIPPIATVEKAAAQAPKAEPSAEKATGSTTGIDFESQIRKPIVALAGAGRRDVAIEILKKFGAAKASEIKPEDYAAAVEAIKAAG